MKRIFNCLLLFFLAASCQNIEKTPKPEKFIPEPVMINILEDLAKIDAAANLNKKAFDKAGLSATEYIFQKYGIDSAQFARNNKYYMENLARSKRMYEEVQRRLEAQKMKLDSIFQVEDSLRELEKKSLRRDTVETEPQNPRGKAQKFYSVRTNDTIN